MDTLFLELTVIVGYLVWSPVYGKETKCKAEFEMACLIRVSCEFNVKVIDERREFMVEYKRPGQIGDVIAACQWRNEQFSCDPVKGILCEAQPGNNFTVLIDTKEKCLTDGEIRFDVAHEQLIRCELSSELSSDKSASNINIKSNMTQAAIETSGSRADENSVTAGVIAGVVISSLVISVIVSIWFWKRGCRKLITKINKQKDVENVDDQESQKCMVQGTEGNVSKGDNRSPGHFSVVPLFCIRSPENKAACVNKENNTSLIIHAP